MNYYSIPFTPKEGKEFSKVNTEDSIRQHISFLLSTMPGSFRFSPFYGSLLNKHHFHLPDKRKGEKKLEQELKLKLQQNLRFLVGKYEPRLTVEEIEVGINLAREGEIQPNERGGRITFRINITGSINGREPFLHSEAFFLR